MTPANILLMTAAFAFAATMFFAYMAIRHRGEDVSDFLAITAVVFVIAGAACVTEAIKDARLRHPVQSSEVTP